jgi:type VI secretion system protein ImpE
VALLVQALQAQASGDSAGAQALRDQALEQAPPIAGTVDGHPFEWICDADSRLGPVLEAVVNGRYCWVPFAALRRVQIEAPEDLRDLVWTPAHLEFPNGGDAIALIPTRYVGSTALEDERIWMARRTEWQPLGGEQFAGLGQRVFATEAGEHALLDIRSIELQSS